MQFTVGLTKLPVKQVRKKVEFHSNRTVPLAVNAAESKRLESQFEFEEHSAYNLVVRDRPLASSVMELYTTLHGRSRCLH